MRDPTIIFTNGSADFGGDVSNFSCIDNDSEEGHETVAVVCVGKKPAESPAEDPRQDCQKNGQVCLPKCCQLEEVFNVEKMTCEQVNEFLYYLLKVGIGVAERFRVSKFTIQRS